MAAVIGPAYRKGLRVRSGAEEWSSYRVPEVISNNRISYSTRRTIAQLMARAFEAGYEFARTRNAVIDRQGFLSKEETA